MNRLFNVLLSLAILFSVVSAAAFFSDLMVTFTTVAPERHSYGEPVGGVWETRLLMKHMIYWSLGLAGVFAMTRIVTSRGYWRNALVIAFGWLLILGSYGGLDLSGNLPVRIVLSLLNVVIFARMYWEFERTYHPAAEPAAAAV